MEEERIGCSNNILNEQEHERSLRPAVFEEFIGQKKITENLKIFIQSAKMRNVPLDHVLLAGPPGLGKTTLALIIARDLGVNIKATSAPIIEKARLSTSKDATAIIVKTRITSIKMASSSARGLSGDHVGKSEMAAEVRLIDASTRKTLRKESLTTDNLSPSTPLSERTLPTELGKMIGEFISQSVGRN